MEFGDKVEGVRGMLEGVVEGVIEVDFAIKGPGFDIDGSHRVCCPTESTKSWKE